MTRIRLALLGLAGYGLVVALFTLLVPWDGWYLLLVVTWLLAIAALVGWAIFRVFFVEPPTEDGPELTQRVRNAAGIVLSRGAENFRASNRVSTLLDKATGRDRASLSSSPSNNGQQAPGGLMSVGV